MKIAVASGKGGTGKSTVAVNFAYLLSKKYKNVCIVDCDVEEPNCHLFLNPGFSRSESVFTLVPQVDLNKCTKCGKCAEICEYNALAFVKGKVIVFPELCHSCGSCKLVCPAQAIEESNKDIGIIEEGFGEGFKFLHGKLKIGQAMSPPLIKSVKKSAEEFNIKVLDCPPGTSCPVIADRKSVV